MNQPLSSIIEKLKQGASEDEAFFGIYEVEEDSENYCIKANKRGMELFTAEMLQALNAPNWSDAKLQEKAIEISASNNWMALDSEVFIRFVQPLQEKPAVIEPPEMKDDWKETAFKFGCIAALICLVFATIVGLCTMFNWIF